MTNMNNGISNLFSSPGMNNDIYSKGIFSIMKSVLNWELFSSQTDVYFTKLVTFVNLRSTILDNTDANRYDNKVICESTVESLKLAEKLYNNASKGCTIPEKKIRSGFGRRVRKRSYKKLSGYVNERRKRGRSKKRTSGKTSNKIRKNRSYIKSDKYLNKRRRSSRRRSKIRSINKKKRGSSKRGSSKRGSSKRRSSKGGSRKVGSRRRLSIRGRRSYKKKGENVVKRSRRIRGRSMRKKK